MVKGFRSELEADNSSATARLNSMVQGYDWDIIDTYAAQSLCPYETVSIPVTL